MLCISFAMFTQAPAMVILRTVSVSVRCVSSLFSTLRHYETVHCM